MAKKYMVGTLDDYPLLIVELDGVKYFVHEKNREVFRDEPGLPKVSEDKLAEAVLEKANDL